MNEDLTKSICSISGFTITECGRWENLKLAENYIISFRKIGDNFVDVHGRGNILDFDAKKFQSLIENFIIDMNIQIPYVEMRNYEDIKGSIPTKETLVVQKNFFMKNKQKCVGFIGYNISSPMKMILLSATRQYKKVNVALSACKNYENAIESAISIVANYNKNYYKKEKKVIYKVSNSEIEAVSLLCGKLLWEDLDILDLEEYELGSESPLYPIVENISIVREELLNLEKYSILKANELEEEKLQTEKIVESLKSSILIVDHINDVIIDANPAACNLLECSKENLLKDPFSLHVSSYKSGKSIEDAEELFNRDHYKIGEWEEIVYTSKGIRIPVLRSSVKIRMQGSDYTLEHFIDISRAKNHEAELKKSLSLTRQLNNLTFNREKRIIEMKKEVNDLLNELNREPKYSSVIDTKEG